MTLNIQIETINNINTAENNPNYFNFLYNKKCFQNITTRKVLHVASYVFAFAFSLIGNLCFAPAAV